jgi:CspA family cold shock protein
MSALLVANRSAGCKWPAPRKQEPARAFLARRDGGRQRPRFNFGPRRWRFLFQVAIMLGTIRRINAERGFGFLRPVGEQDSTGDHFFHCRDLVDFVFDERIVGQTVQFDSVQGDKGLRAANVRPQ